MAYCQRCGEPVPQSAERCKKCRGPPVSVPYMDKKGDMWSKMYLKKEGGVGSEELSKVVGTVFDDAGVLGRRRYGCDACHKLVHGGGTIDRDPYDPTIKYCEECYRERFTQGTCYACYGTVTYDSFVRAPRSDRIWHKGCCRCKHCHKDVSENVVLNLREEPVCEKCFEKEGQMPAEREAVLPEEGRGRVMTPVRTLRPFSPAGERRMLVSPTPLTPRLVSLPPSSQDGSPMRSPLSARRQGLVLTMPTTQRPFSPNRSRPLHRDYTPNQYMDPPLLSPTFERERPLSRADSGSRSPSPSKIVRVSSPILRRPMLETLNPLEAQLAADSPKQPFQPGHVKRASSLRMTNFLDMYSKLGISSSKAAPPAAPAPAPSPVVQRTVVVPAPKLAERPSSVASGKTTESKHAESAPTVIDENVRGSGADTPNSRRSAVTIADLVIPSGAPKRDPGDHSPTKPSPLGMGYPRRQPPLRRRNSTPKHWRVPSGNAEAPVSKIEEPARVDTFVRIPAAKEEEPVEYCVDCKKELDTEWVSTSDGAKHHRECFKCGVCAGEFDEGPTSVVTYNGELAHPRCAPVVSTWTERTIMTPRKMVPIFPKPNSASPNRRDFSNATAPKSPTPGFFSTRNRPLPRFGGAEKCPAAGCGLNVYPTDSHPGPRGKKWHKKCIRCVGCSAQGDSTSYVEIDEKMGAISIFCRACQDEKKGRKREGMVII
ncbi:hypothetical protein SAICODRAFT_21239 [Saitoella complicata NRRL Y-17804]|uniref:uncharacterized protein n=1 Tax=Saitoella complicata (strain BCRC 22490 / CBS 7301 / JCM 7358 / NBRC 10748 / NRRL Y-17804) TaxID=698492 RepID=UPI00086755B8|nr:uncharacterized protein SAICODRAFT_21239 [Saitoella complicata NRRL Y-17804]ODQ50890.1 hypothetical protein SAICODRAFT_21239 [Saitoella complicata NRRL Y-17804]